jgi:rhodanese-related sulfurtransferase
VNIISLNEWKSRSETAGSGRRIIDVRSANEFASGHLPGAINIPLEQLEMRGGDLEGCSEFLLVCQGGTRAKIGAGWMAQCGKTVLVLEGGTGAWKQAGLPLVRSVAAKWSLERQVRMVAGLLVLTSVVLSLTVYIGWIALAGFVGAGLTFAGATDICAMGLLLAKMPWNRTRRCVTDLTAVA